MTSPKLRKEHIRIAYKRGFYDGNARTPDASRHMYEDSPTLMACYQIGQDLGSHKDPGAFNPFTIKE